MITKTRVLYLGMSNCNEVDIWNDILERKQSECDKIRIDCWNDQVELIEELQGYDCTIDTSYSKMTTFEFDNTDELYNELVMKAFSDEGVKWFSLFLMNGDHSVFTSEHEGREFTISDESPEEYERIINALPEGIIHILS